MRALNTPQTVQDTTFSKAAFLVPPVPLVVGSSGASSTTFQFWGLLTWPQPGSWRPPRRVLVFTLTCGAEGSVCRQQGQREHGRSALHKAFDVNEHGR